MDHFQLNGMDVVSCTFLTNHVKERLLCLYRAPTKEESKKLRGERNQIKFIDLRLKDGRLQDSGKQEGTRFHMLSYFFGSDRK